MADRKTAIISIRMNCERKREMESFFEDLGLSLDSGVSLFFEQCIMLAGLPFEVKPKNASKPFAEELVPGEVLAPKSVLFSLRMDPYKKDQVEYTFEELGIKTSDAVNMYFEACLNDWGIPFRIGYPKPNAETLTAMQEAEDIRTGKVPVVKYNTVEELIAAWESGDYERDQDIATEYGSLKVYQEAMKLEEELVRGELKQGAAEKENYKV